MFEYVRLLVMFCLWYPPTFQTGKGINTEHRDAKSSFNSTDANLPTKNSTVKYPWGWFVSASLTTPGSFMLHYLLSTYSCGRYFYLHTLIFHEIRQDLNVLQTTLNSLMGAIWHYNRIWFCKIYFSWYFIMLAYDNNVAITYKMG